MTKRFSPRLKNHLRVHSDQLQDLIPELEKAHPDEAKDLAAMVAWMHSITDPEPDVSPPEISSDVPPVEQIPE